MILDILQPITHSYHAILPLLAGMLIAQGAGMVGSLIGASGAWGKKKKVAATYKNVKTGNTQTQAGQVSGAYTDMKTVEDKPEHEVASGWSKAAPLVGSLVGGAGGIAGSIVGAGKGGDAKPNVNGTEAAGYKDLGISSGKMSSGLDTMQPVAAQSLINPQTINPVANAPISTGYGPGMDTIGQPNQVEDLSMMPLKNNMFTPQMKSGGKTDNTYGQIKSIKKYKGPSHEEGGIDTTLGGKPVEVEGDEYRVEMTDGTKAVLNKAQYAALQGGVPLKQILDSLPNVSGGEKGNTGLIDGEPETDLPNVIRRRDAALARSAEQAKKNIYLDKSRNLTTEKDDAMYRNFSVRTFWNQPSKGESDKSRNLTTEKDDAGLIDGDPGQPNDSLNVIKRRDAALARSAEQAKKNEYLHKAETIISKKDSENYLDFRKNKFQYTPAQFSTKTGPDFFDKEVSGGLGIDPQNNPYRGVPSRSKKITNDVDAYNKKYSDPGLYGQPLIYGKTNVFNLSGEPPEKKESGDFGSGLGPYNPNYHKPMIGNPDYTVHEDKWKDQPGEKSLIDNNYPVNSNSGMPGISKYIPGYKEPEQKPYGDYLPKNTDSEFRQFSDTPTKDDKKWTDIFKDDAFWNSAANTVQNIITATQPRPKGVTIPKANVSDPTYVTPRSANPAQALAESGRQVSAGINALRESGQVERIPSLINAGLDTNAKIGEQFAMANMQAQSHADEVNAAASNQVNSLRSQLDAQVNEKNAQLELARLEQEGKQDTERYKALFNMMHEYQNYKKYKYDDTMRRAILAQMQTNQITGASLIQ